MGSEWCVDGVRYSLAEGDGSFTSLTYISVQRRSVKQFVNSVRNL
jgi:hypothetical protein